ncbi:MAG: c-type cytochrome [Verrucomicrobiales bacterium]|nr:c-type cytochrome [Verrucomicrobiales bacterium]
MLLIDGFLSLILKKKRQFFYFFVIIQVWFVELIFSSKSMISKSRLLTLGLVLMTTWSINAQTAKKTSASTDGTDFTPTAHDPNIAKITLFTSNPDIVTPIGIAVAPDGRVFVQENHTHKRLDSYNGPKTDRILIFEDTNGDGISDKRTIFYEGLVSSTDLLFGSDGHLYVSTRSFIGRFRDAATKQKASGEPEVLISCETGGKYPHNGIGGLAIDPANPTVLAFGFGENHGADYTFTGSDGGSISGGGEGGSTYTCNTDGSKLKRQSTGHWNAFGMAYDLKGNLFCTDNDPNSRPPNRLLHIVEGADYGYEYRYGRSGLHPLISWDGSTPGTLGMISSLGEAACGVIAHGPNQLLTASWTDNRIDQHVLESNGASFIAPRKTFISGPDNFRPVHFSYSLDGKYLYFTDWVELSYSVHGHGRVWRVEFKKPINLKPFERQEKMVLTAKEALQALGNKDPYIRTEAIRILQQHPEVLKAYKWQGNESSTARAHYAVAIKKQDPNDSNKNIPELLQDESEDVRYVAIKWIADENFIHYKKSLEQQLNRRDMSRQSIMAVLSALAKLDGASGDFSPGQKMNDLALDESKPTKLRAIALQLATLPLENLAQLAKSKELAIVRQAIYSLAIHKDEKRSDFLSQLIIDEALDANLRADALAALAPFAQDHLSVLTDLSRHKNAIISTEAKRTLASAGIQQRSLETKPLPTDIDAWVKFINQAPGKINRAVGRRLFFHSRLGTCYNCHSMNGRGSKFGPDLTAIYRQDGVDQKWLLQHIVNPSAEVAPYYYPQKITTKDGKVQMGFILGKEGVTQDYVGVDGEVFNVKKDRIVNREEIAMSIMPPGLLYPMTASEIRDLVAFLLKNDTPAIPDSAIK